MISYETVLKLKEAGFPQDTVYGNYITPDGVTYSCPPNETVGTQDIRMPTLSELIEACGVWKEDPTFYEPYSSKVVNPCFFTLYAEMRNGTAVWIAGYKYRNEYYEWICEGPTPEEAVAALWLALQK